MGTNYGRNRDLDGSSARRSSWVNISDMAAGEEAGRRYTQMLLENY